MAGKSLLLNIEQFRNINGYSNQYWEWKGAEPDFLNRILLAGYELDQLDASIGRYMINEYLADVEKSIHSCRHNLQHYTRLQWQYDGLNSLRYKVVNITFGVLYTHILVDLLEKEERRSSESFCKQLERVINAKLI
ncbi:unnamed protein product [Cylicocyclus nassatus]|uniref:Galactosyltransferase C-terminal domain-containing protein n=1 Tax=Cylicocyclus nassatus TaxID=53992 RepID=A0AA36DK20_CYLNA|nr:unnamed protein product [Cylicocyclus nassatus]